MSRGTFNSAWLSSLDISSVSISLAMQGIDESMQMERIIELLCKYPVKELDKSPSESTTWGGFTLSYTISSIILDLEPDIQDSELFRLCPVATTGEATLSDFMSRKIGDACRSSSEKKRGTVP